MIHAHFPHPQAAKVLSSNHNSALAISRHNPGFSHTWYGIVHNFWAIPWVYLTILKIVSRSEHVRESPLGHTVFAIRGGTVSGPRQDKHDASITARIPDKYHPRRRSNKEA